MSRGRDAHLGVVRQLRQKLWFNGLWGDLADLCFIFLGNNNMLCTHYFPENPHIGSLGRSVQFAVDEKQHVRFSFVLRLNTEILHLNNIHTGSPLFRDATRHVCTVSVGWFIHPLISHYFKTNLSTQQISAAFGRIKTRRHRRTRGRRGGLTPNKPQHPASFAFHHHLIVNHLLMDSARHSAVQWMGAIQTKKTYFTASTLYNTHIYKQELLLHETQLGLKEDERLA